MNNQDGIRGLNERGGWPPADGDELRKILTDQGFYHRENNFPFVGGVPNFGQTNLPNNQPGVVTNGQFSYKMETSKWIDISAEKTRTYSYLDGDVEKHLVLNGVEFLRVDKINGETIHRVVCETEGKREAYYVSPGWLTIQVDPIEGSDPFPEVGYGL